MQAFELAEIVQQRAETDHIWLEFFRVPSLSVGLYELPAGSADPQQPHSEDEVYYVIEGKATICVGGVERPVQPGSIIYVAAHAEHRFHNIEEDLRILVFFAPAEGSQQK